MLENISNNMDAMLEALKSNKEVFGLSGKEEILANQEAGQDSKGDNRCAECNIQPKTHSSYCQSCWHAKMMDN